MGLLHAEESWVTLAPREEVAAALEARVVEGPLLALDGGGSAERPVRGQVRATTASVIRRVVMRNSFAPVVSVSFADAPGGGTSVRCELEPHPVMMALVGAATVLAALAGLGFAVQDSPVSLAAVAVLIALPAVGPALAVAGFRSELPRTLEALRALWPPQGEAQPGSTSLQSSSAEGVHGSSA